MAKEIQRIFINGGAIAAPSPLPSTSKPATVADSEPTQTIKDVEYKLSDLAKLDEKSNLGLKLLKPRNQEAARGSQFEVLLVNKTNLIVRREWVSKSQLLVIIPEKLIYKIFNEQTGECIYTPEKAFMDELQTYTHFDDGGRFTGYTGPNTYPLEFTEEQLLYLGEKPNQTDFSKFFQNINHGDIVKEITKSELLWKDSIFKRVDYFYNNRKYEWVNTYKFSPLNFGQALKYETFEHRQLTCLYYKAPIILTNEAIRREFPLHSIVTQGLTMATLKLSLKLLQEFQEKASHVSRLTRVWGMLGWWPDESPITDINILRRIFKNIVIPEERWQRDTENELRNAVYTYAFGINEWDKYKKYLKDVEYVSLSQAHYFDIIKKAKALNNGKLKEKYPVHWLTWENKVNKIYNEHERFIKAQRTFTYNEAIEKLEHITADDNKDYDYIIKLPRTYGEILEEGEKMHHCVGGYADGIYNGDKVVLFLRKKDKPDKPYGTIDVIWEDKTKLSTYKIHQVKGRANTSLPIEVISYIVKYIKLKNLKGVDEYYVKRDIEDGTLARYEAELERRKEEAKKAKEEQ